MAKTKSKGQPNQGQNQPSQKPKSQPQNQNKNPQQSNKNKQPNKQVNGQQANGVNGKQMDRKTVNGAKQGKGPKNQKQRQSGGICAAFGRFIVKMILYTILLSLVAFVAFTLYDHFVTHKSEIKSLQDAQVAVTRSSGKVVDYLKSVQWEKHRKTAILYANKGYSQLNATLNAYGFHWL